MPIPNLYSTLGRQGAAKTFSHGYVQSFVAATHPSTYPNSHHRNGFTRRPSRLAKVGSYQFQNAFHQSVAASTGLSIQDLRAEKTLPGGGLDAYFEAWRKQHPPNGPEKEWTQFQFAKTIEWNPSAESVDLKAKESDDLHTEIFGPPRAGLERAVTDPVLPAAAPEKDDEAYALAEIDAKVADEIRALHLQALEQQWLAAVSKAPPSSLAPSHSPALTDRSFPLSPAHTVTTVSTIADAKSQSLADTLNSLAEEGNYVDIPKVFKAVTNAGTVPLASSYNLLLQAAIKIIPEQGQVVEKALQIYTDMLRKKVVPDTATYVVLLDILASRAIEVAGAKKTLEVKRLRYGGMEQAGSFMFTSTELDYDTLSLEGDRLELAMNLFGRAVAGRGRVFPVATYQKLIEACAAQAEVANMVKLYEHMESNKTAPQAAIFTSMIRGFGTKYDLNNVVECYNEYRKLAIAQYAGTAEIAGRLVHDPHAADANVYAAVAKAQIDAGKFQSAINFYESILKVNEGDSATLKDVLVSRGFVDGMLDQKLFSQALLWAELLDDPAKMEAMSKIATMAADHGDRTAALSAFAHVPMGFHGMIKSAMALLALNIREGNMQAARKYWHLLSSPEVQPTSAFIEPAAMYAVALIGSGQTLEGLVESEQFFQRIQASENESKATLEGLIAEGTHFIATYMAKRNIVDPRTVPEHAPYAAQPFSPIQYTAPSVQAPFEDSYDPYAASTDFKGSGMIADELEKGAAGRAKASRLNEAMGRFRNIRRAGRHPRYITYARLIAAAAREERMNLVHDILGMARSDVPLRMEYPSVRYGWVSILDAMVGACLTTGNRKLAAQYHQELLDMGAAPTANTFGLYITTLKESTKTFDEASEAVKIFHRAKSEGVEPSSFLYNALIGKLGKARRIDDCLFYFAEMRGHGIRPTSVTYGTIVNALCRVSDEKFAEELFEEMESMPNYKARPAPYNSLMQFFLTTKRDKKKVLAYYERMKSKGIQPTNHTYKLLVDTHATLEPVNMSAAEAILDVIRSTGQKPEAVHYSSLIHAKGCVLHDVRGARAVFDSVLADPSIRPQACLYQAMFESMVANHVVADTEPILADMAARRVEMTPYIANTLIHGWANESNIGKSRAIFDAVGRDKREPSTYEAMTRAYLAVEDRKSANRVVQEMLERGYPTAVSGKILELVGGGHQEQ